MRRNSVISHIMTFNYMLHTTSLKCLGAHAFRTIPSHATARWTRHSNRSTSNMSMSMTSNSQQERKKIAVIGGGASGMFAATAAADYLQKFHADRRGDGVHGCDVIVFEGTSRTMSKVRISGGGRCNVMHDRTKPLPQILSSYPRGSKELREGDGRMFPDTDDSQTIIDAITNAAIRAGVRLRIKEKVENVEWRKKHNGEAKCFALKLSSKTQSQERIITEEVFDSVVLATGSFPIGHEIARSLGHNIVMPVPSLFTFDAKDLVKENGLFHGLAGVSLPMARLSLTITDDMRSSANELPADEMELSDTKITSNIQKKKKRGAKKKTSSIIQEGPLLITHHGISGPATLRLSAFAAREFHAVNYKCKVNIHFCPKFEEEQRLVNGASGSSDTILTDELWKMTQLIPKRKISTGCPLFMKDLEYEGNGPIISKRLWSTLVKYSSIPTDTTWGDASKSMIRSLASALTSFPLTVTSKGTFKEEFVTAGGIHLKEVDMTNMESKIIPGLFMCGEVLDVDGVTGGFNFMNCWSTGFVAGEGAAEFCMDNN
ncbi:hypothetical protein HJC23_007287 [Cyclotella cryptica]|uniref:Aminoacetone oxidase family FAD-binding enzyme n=1 Tax=Cyclotella cryptica TaxID=29204 RepID=A0ABD3Q0I5_9STRA